MQYQKAHQKFSLYGILKEMFLKKGKANHKQNEIRLCRTVASHILPSHILKADVSKMKFDLDLRTRCLFIYANKAFICWRSAMIRYQNYCSHLENMPTFTYFEYSSVCEQFILHVIWMQCICSQGMHIFTSCPFVIRKWFVFCMSWLLDVKSREYRFSREFVCMSWKC